MNTELFDVEVWIPFRGGEYHCTIAVACTKEYVDYLQNKNNQSLEQWKNAPSGIKLPFHPGLKVLPHDTRDTSWIKAEIHNKLINEAKENSALEAKIDAYKYSMDFMTIAGKRQFLKYLSEEIVKKLKPEEETYY